MPDSIDWRRWLERAEISFKRSEEDIPEYPPDACFGLHFCAELYLKAVLLSRPEIPEKRHHLHHLPRQVTPTLEADSLEYKAAMLTTIGFGQRYPSDLDSASALEAQAVLQADRLIRA
jgi:HEPN domain-containing protein